MEMKTNQKKCGHVWRRLTVMSHSFAWLHLELTCSWTCQKFGSRMSDNWLTCWSNVPSLTVSTTSSFPLSPFPSATVSLNLYIPSTRLESLSTAWWSLLLMTSCYVCRESKSDIRGTKRLVSENICSVEGNSAGIFVSKVSPGTFVIKVKWMPIIFGGIKLPFWVR